VQSEALLGLFARVNASLYLTAYEIPAQLHTNPLGTSVSYRRDFLIRMCNSGCSCVQDLRF
jgi:hypothetical protein